MQVVIFDLGNVIAPFDFMICCSRLAEHSPYTPEYIYRHIFKSQIMYNYEEGILSSKEFFARLSAELKLELDYAGFCPIWEDIFTENSAVSRIIEGLQNGYRLFLLSNTNELHFEYIYRKFAVMKLFEAYILSYKVGHMKPDSRIFKQALKLAKAAPAEIIYIDDIPKYAQAATDLGMCGIHFSSASRLKYELSHYGVKLNQQV
jgi:FMN phosphatase YigB (HAD superfamily)